MKIMCIGAHPDDLEVGMGGSISRFVEEGHDVKMIVVTIPNQKDETRTEEIKNGAKKLGVNDYEFLDYDANELRADRKFISVLDKAIKKFQPDEVYTHWAYDSHQDHRAVSYATIAALRKNKCSLYMYEQTIPGGITEQSFRPQLFIKIDNHIDKKIEALTEHKSQIDANNPENTWIYGVKGRAQYRGYQVNCKYAEAFEVVKTIR